MMALAVCCPLDAATITNAVPVVSASEFFRPADDPPAGLDPNGIYPQGQKIGFGLYSITGWNDAQPGKTNMQRVSEGGFTLAGPFCGAPDPANIDDAIANNLKVTFRIEVGPYKEAGDVPRPLDAAYVQAEVRGRVESLINNPVHDAAVARWCILPEELRWWRSSEMECLQLVSETIRQVELEHHAAARPIWMYEPNHRWQYELVKTGQYQDIVSMGVYVNKVPRAEGRSARARWGFEQIVGAAAELGTVPQAVFELCGDLPDPQSRDPAAIRQLLRHDVYLGLVLGIKSINIWSMLERPGLTTHEEQFTAYASVAADLNGPLDLQKVFLFGQRRSDLTVTLLSGQPTTLPWTDWWGGVHEYDSVSFLEAAYGHDRYLFIVNSTEEPVEIAVSGLPTDDDFRIESLFDESVPAVTGGCFQLVLEPLEVKAFRMSPTHIPQPTTLALLCAGAAGAILKGRCGHKPVRN